MTDLSCLSRDELIALLQKKEEEATAANARLVTAETKASQAEAIARQAEEKVIQAEKQVEQYLLGLDDEFAKTALNAVLRYVQDSRKIMASNQRQIVTFFSKGNEAFTSVEQAETSVAKSLTELKKAPSFSNNVR